MEAALQGLRVLEPAQYYAGPVAGLMLADMGAEVIHIERPGVGDPMRQLGVRIGQQSSRFLFLNRNKKSVTLDIGTPRGAELFKGLAEKSDVVISNFAPGTLERLGLGYDELARVNPRIVVALVSGFGQSGPYRHRLGFDLVAQAASGTMEVTGYPDRPPTRAGPPIGDVLGGMLALYGIMAALYWRQMSGKGQLVDASLVEAAFFPMGMWFIEQVNFGAAIERQGNRYPGSGVIDCFRAKDGYFVIHAPTDQIWARLAGLIGREDLVGDPRFDSSPRRREQADLVAEIIEHWAQDRTVEEVDRLLEQAQVPSSPVRSLGELAKDPGLLARQSVISRDDPQFGSLVLPGVPVKLSATPGEVRRLSPSLGEHNRDIYCGLLGLTTAELESLRRDGVV